MRASTVFVSLVALASCVAAAPFEFSSNGTFALDKKAADYSGRFTWYDISVGPTACGGHNKPNEHVVALNDPQWNGGKNCYRQIKITSRGKTTTAAIVDECPGCPYGGLDLTSGLFDFFTWPGAAGSSTDPGVIQGTWEFA